MHRNAMQGVARNASQCEPLTTPAATPKYVDVD
jgi:hypothetical protein